jgi:hypothetical protein
LAALAALSGKGLSRCVDKRKRSSFAMSKNFPRGGDVVWKKSN